MKLLKVQIWRRNDGLIDFQVAAREENGSITFGHAGNVPVRDYQTSLQELLAKMEQGPSVKVPKIVKA